MTKAGDITLVIILIGLATFVVVYSVTAPWWRTTAGRHVMAFMFAAFATVAQRVSRMIFGDYAGADVLRLILLIMVAVVVYWRVYLVIHYQFRPFGREKKVNEAQS